MASLLILPNNGSISVAVWVETIRLVEGALSCGEVAFGNTKMLGLSIFLRPRKWIFISAGNSA